MKFIFIIYILIAYPCDDIETVRYYNSIVDQSFKNFCFLGVEFEYTRDKGKADLVIYPKFDFRQAPWYVGFTNGTIFNNPKIYGTPEILISKSLNRNDELNVLRHEFYHFFCRDSYHSIDSNSLMYPIYTGANIELTKHDSLFLLENYRNANVRDILYRE